jgi:hypothetical protein
MRTVYDAAEKIARENPPISPARRQMHPAGQSVQLADYALIRAASRLRLAALRTAVFLSGTNIS